jgi:dihydropteroate synthase
MRLQRKRETPKRETGNAKRANSRIFAAMFRTLNCRGQLVRLHTPVVMGILNLTPDSFSDGGRFTTQHTALAHTKRMLAEGATFIDVGAASSRPGAVDVGPGEELQRLEAVLPHLIAHCPGTLWSIDTFHPEVAEAALGWGVHMLNDITAGRDARMFSLAAHYTAPLVLLHLHGTPATMQHNPRYADVVAEVAGFLVERVNTARAAGVTDLLLDPGFGFGKTLEHNFTLLRELPQLVQLGLPVLVGLSRKSMVTRALGIAVADSLPATTALHLQALVAGANILRVHDVREAVLAVELWRRLQG